ncbi:DNA-directed RNA polymerase III subunit RPC3-like [Sycon ciliatum]|uniref:DNA-directed RNA polymerase III subunit RPC3-like n=1 Tax=Sycon ciliatum TaxID=27933 RepID=UPI0031F6F34D
MSEKEKVAVNILIDHFGNIVAQVVSYLLAKGPRSLRDLTAETKLKLNEVRKGLLVAVQHGLVAVSERKGPGGSTTTIYTASIEGVVQRQYIPQFIQFARRSFSTQSDLAERVMEDVILNGHLSLSSVIQNALEHPSNAHLSCEEIKSSTMDVFSTFVHKHLVCRSDGPKEDLYVLPRFDLKNFTKNAGEKRHHHSSNDDAPAAKRRNDADQLSATNKQALGELDGKEASSVDSDCCWKPDYSRLFKQLRNEAIVSMVVNTHDVAAGAVMETVLRLSELQDETNSMTVAVSSFELFQALPSTPLLSRAELALYLKLLCDGSTTAYLVKVGDNAGGTYCVQLDKCLDSMAENAIVSLVQERFGSKCLRVFRLLLDKKHLEEKQIGDMAMIPSKEAQELMYRMLRSHFVTLQEVPRTPDHAPSRTFFLFSVNKEHVRQTCLKLAYKSLLHLQQKRLSLEKEHRRLLDRQQQFELQKAKILLSESDGKDKEDDIALLEEDLLPPADKAMVKKLLCAFSRFDEGEVVLSSSLLCLSNFKLL